MLKQSLNLKLQQKLSPQQIQLMKLIQLPTQAFEQRLKEEMNDNPALESGKEEEEDEYEKDEFDNEEQEDFDEDNESIEAEDINIDEYLSNDETPDYKLSANNYSDEEQRESPLAASVSFHQDLLNQLHTFILSEEDREIAEFLVGNIDDQGYIRRSVPDIVDDMAFTQGIYTDEKTVERILRLYKILSPQVLAHAIYRNVCCFSLNQNPLPNLSALPQILSNINSMVLPKNITTSFGRNTAFHRNSLKKPLKK